MRTVREKGSKFKNIYVNTWPWLQQVQQHYRCPLYCYTTQDGLKLFFLTLAMLNMFMYYTPPQFFLLYLQYTSFKQVFSIKVENNVDPDQMASSEAIWSGSTLFSKYGSNSDGSFTWAGYHSPYRSFLCIFYPGWLELFLMVPSLLEPLKFLFVCLFCCFTSQVNSYGHGGTISSPNHTFPWQAWTSD